MKKIAIYGAGGFGREVACLIQKINEKTPEWDIIGFFDDGIEKGTKNEYGVVLGGINEVNEYPDNLAIAVAIASPKIVEKIVSNITSSNIYFPNIISPDVIYLDENNIKIGSGNIICTGCLLSCNVDLGNFNILNGFIPVGHDTKIGNFNSIMPSVKISGEVTIGNRNFFGVNSVVLQQIKIGNDTVIGANSLIIRKTKDGMTYVGSPAKIVSY
ncbi:NeuD/PglB/VioB family sugar acetyltransferase [Proteiniphilum propionicum]|jgi:sugar O-acyltransferase (sialic acid O-acetyltransferase NeuD family)|uniref:NeuD/PglB/VioB family sugar acetyltransferase n=1 Tax=Proteiniphilum propionicum TaxID=2829812 RepID=UPI00181A8748|nr:NeuD/PglB/VioB family sugar acetyltransferase [Proteiniphilum propionicum]NMA30802.1 serine acetyltransferase [Candidatus Methanofastidiosa archaeon]ULB33497.1 NeuD/PglB/VioB family sugar acetyltransferase [Proteiniphilum propionicum]